VKINDDMYRIIKVAFMAVIAVFLISMTILSFASLNNLDDIAYDFNGLGNVPYSLDKIANALERIARALD
jgi:hypothetical protein